MSYAPTTEELGEAFKKALFAEFDESLARVEAVMESTARGLSDVRDDCLASMPL